MTQLDCRLFQGKLKRRQFRPQSDIFKGLTGKRVQSLEPVPRCASHGRLVRANLSLLHEMSGYRRGHTAAVSVKMPPPQPAKRITERLGSGTSSAQPPLSRIPRIR